MVAQGGYIVLTADHGNAEQMVDYETSEPHTAHTLNPVPVVLITDGKDLKCGTASWLTWLRRC